MLIKNYNSQNNLNIINTNKFKSNNNVNNFQSNNNNNNYNYQKANSNLSFSNLIVTKTQNRMLMMILKFYHLMNCNYLGIFFLIKK